MGSFSNLAKLSAHYVQITIDGSSAKVFDLGYIYEKSASDIVINKCPYTMLIRNDSDNQTIYPYLHTADAGVTLTATLVAIYLGDK